MTEKIESYLEVFNEWTKKYPGPVSHSVQFNFKKRTEHIVFCAIIHGDEVGAIPAFLDTIKKIETGEILCGGRITFFLGNVPAALKNKRFLEKDLNRSFNLESTQDTSLERKRALALMQLLRGCDLLFDFHQTTRQSLYPFYAFGFEYQSYLWARVAGCTQMFVTRSANQSFSAGGMCVDEYVRSFGKPAVTLELGQRGFSEQAKKIAEITIQRVLKAAEKCFRNVIPCSSHEIQSSAINTLKKISKKNQDLKFLLTIYKEPFSHPQKKLIDGFVNFSYVHKNQVMGTDENGNEILAPDEGYVLFPKYPPRDEQGNSLEPQSELFIIAKENKHFKEKCLYHSAT